MREKELRLALVCYGGVSLAVYMHGITKEIWRLARASRAFHAGEEPEDGSQGIYHRLLQTIADDSGLHLRVLADILAGASAGGINCVFLAQAISTGQSLEPLTDLWLDHADIDALAARDDNHVRRFAKSAAVPFAWAFSSRSSMVEQTVEAEHQAEVRQKLANLVKTPWFQPPFGGPAFTRILLDAFDAMAAAPCGPPLLPHYQPLDLFVTVTDFKGHPQQLRLHSPSEVLEREHRLILTFRDAGGADRRIADAAELAFAARGTASFPGAFPPFQVGELDGVLAERGRGWPTRDEFLRRTIPLGGAVETFEQAVLVDGGVQANAPFRPCIEALRSRPARREIDRRFVYVDPAPGIYSIRFTGGGNAPPGFFTTLFGALSDIPREQPIRDNLEWIEHRSERIRRMRRIVDSMRPEVEAAIERSFGSTFFLASAGAGRLRGWRSQANEMAARGAGYAYAGYAQLKLSSVLEEMGRTYAVLGGFEVDTVRQRAVREVLWRWAAAAGLIGDGADHPGSAAPALILFFRNFDVGFRIRRLRLLARQLSAGVNDLAPADRTAADRARQILYKMISRYEAPTTPDMDSPLRPDERAAFAAADSDPAAAADALAARLNLKALDDETDICVVEALADLPRTPRRAFILDYLGFPFYDIATLPLLQGEGLEEFDPIKVDRISPDDAVAIRAGGTLATLKGIQFNNFGAFFSRAYRENDYLWGRLHGVDRLIDIIASTLPDEAMRAPERLATLKREAFRAILAEERPRLTAIQPLFDQLAEEIDTGSPPADASPH